MWIAGDRRKNRPAAPSSVGSDGSPASAQPLFNEVEERVLADLGLSRILSPARRERLRRANGIRRAARPRLGSSRRVLKGSIP